MVAPEGKEGGERMEGEAGGRCGGGIVAEKGGAQKVKYKLSVNRCIIYGTCYTTWRLCVTPEAGEASRGGESRHLTNRHLEKQK